MKIRVVIVFYLLSFSFAAHVIGEDLLVTIGKTTTKITSPLKPDGYPDYLAALNTEIRGETTPQNNLAVGIWRTFGPASIPPELRPLFFNTLGIDELPEEGNYLIDLATYHRQLLGTFDASKTTADEYSAKSKTHEDDYSFVMHNAWTQESHPNVFEWRAKHLNHIQALIQLITTHDHYYQPYVIPSASSSDDKDSVSPVLISILLPGAQQAREVARALAIDAHYHLGKGDLDAAIRNSIATHRMGRLTAQGGTLIEGLVGVAISQIASAIDRHILATHGLDAKQLQTHLGALKSLPPMSSFIDKINVSERYMFLDTTIHVAKYGTFTMGLLDGSPNTPQLTSDLGKALSSSLVDWDHVLRRGNYWYDEMYRIGTIKNIHQRTKAHADFEKQLKAIAKQTSDPVSLAKEVLLSGKSLPELTSEQMSNVMVSLLMPSLVTVIDAENRGLMETEINQVGIALELHYLKNQSYPSKLSDLIGPSLRDLPEDRFNEKGLTYKKTTTGYLLYSFGINREDDQGRSRDENPSADDLALKRQR